MFFSFGMLPLCYDDKNFNCFSWQICDFGCVVWGTTVLISNSESHGYCYRLSHLLQLLFTWGGLLGFHFHQLCYMEQNICLFAEVVMFSAKLWLYIL